MLWCVVVAVVVIVAAGQQITYDGTTLDGNVVVVGGPSSGSNFPEAASQQSEPVLVITLKPQGVPPRGVFHHDGVLHHGVPHGVLHHDGVLHHGVPHGVFHHDGVLHHGVPHGVFHHDGVLHHGVPQGVFHHDGVLHHGVPHGVFHHDGVLHHGVPQGVFHHDGVLHHDVPHGMVHGVSHGTFHHDSVPHAVVHHSGFLHGAFHQGEVPVVAPAVSQAAMPVVAAAAQEDFTIGLHVTPQRTSPVTAPVLPQPVLPAPRGPLPCELTSGTLVHATTDNRHEYHFSWCNLPGHTFSHDQAKDYCLTLPSDGHPTGFRLLSIEDQTEDSFISGVIASYHVPYIWTSGEKVGPSEFKWHRTFTLQYTHWSTTGSLGRSQPDNADGDEDCLAVLNNVYMDGITWHDVGCSFDKYVICERHRAYGS